MKFLHVIGQLGFGGAEVLCANHVVWLQAANNDVTVFSLKQVMNSVQQRLQDSGIRLIYGSSVRLERPPPVTRMNITEALSLFWHMLTNRYDVIHAHLFPAMYLVSLFARITRYKGSLIFTEHSNDNRRRVEKLRGMERFIYGRYDQIVCVSDQVAASLKKWQPRLEKKIVMISNGINMDRFSRPAPASREGFSLPMDKICIANVGGFRVEKNQKLLIQALSALGEQYHLLCIGDGVEIGRCKELAQVLGVAERVTFWGDTDLVPELLSCCDLYAQASFFEGYGMACLEAMAVGLPVVSSRVMALTEIIGPEGVYFDPNDPAEAASAIVSVAENVVERQRLVNLGARLSAQADQRRCFVQLDHLYQTLRSGF